MDIDFPSESIRNVYNRIKNGDSVLLSGPGGVGKSYCIRWLAKHMLSEGVSMDITATTGISALNLSDNEDITVSTFHSFAGIKTGEGNINSLLNSIVRNGAISNWKNCKILVIDEISMMGGGLFDKMNAIAKHIRNSDLPFGGIVLVLSGDLLQLPPVKDSWIFTSDAWKELRLYPFVFETPYRYPDPDFFHLLLRARKGELTDRDTKILRIRRRAHRDFQKVISQMGEAQKRKTVIPTLFHSKRDAVDNYNITELSKLKTEEIVFECQDDIAPKYPGSVIREKMSSADIKNLLDQASPRTVTVKVGAQVMVNKNVDINSGIVNGTRGIVISASKGAGLVLRLVNGREVMIAMYETYVMTKHSRVTRKQIPIILAYALTIHKAQGCTLDCATVNLGSSIFSAGQAYVALSRCRTISGLFISDLDISTIRADRVALAQDRRINIFFKCGIPLSFEFEKVVEMFMFLREFFAVPEDVITHIKEYIIKDVLWYAT